MLLFIFFLFFPTYNLRSWKANIEFSGLRNFDVRRVLAPRDVRGLGSSEEERQDDTVIETICPCRMHLNKVELSALRPCAMNSF